MPQAFGAEDPRTFGMDAAAGFPPHKVKVVNDAPNIVNWLKVFDRRFAGWVVWYDDLVRIALENRAADFRLFPGVLPQWDNEARSANRSLSIAGSTPEKYREWLIAAGRQVCDVEEPDERIVFINAWNEWAEGALEPDRHYGAAYLLATSQALELLSHQAGVSASSPERIYSPLDVPLRSHVNVIRSLPRRASRRFRVLVSMLKSSSEDTGSRSGGSRKRLAT